MAKIGFTRGYGDSSSDSPVRGRRSRPVLVVVAGVVTFVGLTGAGFGIAGALPAGFSPPTSAGSSAPTDSESRPDAGVRVMCARTLSAEADLSALPAGAGFDRGNPAPACAQHWDAMWGGDGTPKPNRFAACYHPNGPGGGGGAVVYPADGHPDAATACAAINTKTIPTTR